MSIFNDDKQSHLRTIEDSLEDWNHLQQLIQDYFLEDNPAIVEAKLKIAERVFSYTAENIYEAFRRAVKYGGVCDCTEPDPEGEIYRHCGTCYSRVDLRDRTLQDL